MIMLIVLKTSNLQVVRKSDKMINEIGELIQLYTYFLVTIFFVGPGKFES